MPVDVLMPPGTGDTSLLGEVITVHHVLDYRDGMERAAAKARPRQRAEWAILLPRGRWWRKISTRLANPDGREPSIFHSRDRAEDEMADVRGLLRTDFGLRRRDIPRLRLMVRDVEIGADGTETVGKWQCADELATAR